MKGWSHAPFLFQLKKEDKNQENRQKMQNIHEMKLVQQLLDNLIYIDQCFVYTNLKIEFQISGRDSAALA